MMVGVFEAYSYIKPNETNKEKLMKNKKVFWCTNCLNMSSRQRITFDEKGWCNACQWME